WDGRAMPSLQSAMATGPSPRATVLGLPLCSQDSVAFVVEELPVVLEAANAREARFSQPVDQLRDRVPGSMACGILHLDHRELPKGRLADHVELHPLAIELQQEGRSIHPVEDRPQAHRRNRNRRAVGAEHASPALGPGVKLDRAVVADGLAAYCDA